MNKISWCVLLPLFQKGYAYLGSSKDYFVVPLSQGLSKSTDNVCLFSCLVLVGLSSRLFAVYKPVLVPANVLYLSVMPSLKQYSYSYLTWVGLNIWILTTGY